MLRVIPNAVRNLPANNQFKLKSTPVRNLSLANNQIKLKSTPVRNLPANNQFKLKSTPERNLSLQTIKSS